MLAHLDLSDDFSFREEWPTRHPGLEGGQLGRGGFRGSKAIEVGSGIPSRRVRLHHAQDNGELSRSEIVHTTRFVAPEVVRRNCLMGPDPGRGQARVGDQPLKLDLFPPW